MHELSVCQALIGQVEKVARENDARRVVAIVIAVGPLSGVEAGLLEHAYPIAAVGTLAEHATLTVEAVPVRVRCRSCGAETGALPPEMRMFVVILFSPLRRQIPGRPFPCGGQGRPGRAAEGRRDLTVRS